MWSGTPAVAALHDVTRDRFECDVVPAGRPVILRGLVDHWPVVEAARRSEQALFDLLKRKQDVAPIQAWFGQPGIDGRFSYSDDLAGFNHERRILRLSELLDYLLAHRDDPAAFSAYAGGVPIARHLPSLLSELPMPLLDRERELLVSLWVGSRSRTAAHWDVPQNLACVVLGRRRFTLFPTEQVRNLYVGPVDFTLAGQPTSLVDFAAPDLERFPRFVDAMAAAEVAELEPGDALYVPSLWWHHVEALDPVGAMINFWWRDGPAHLVTPLFTLLHALLTLRDLPEPERKAWRTLFDHYIFQLDGDPMRHLPDGAKGLFSPATPDLLARLRAVIADSLRP